jgi:hypothetical protein
LEGASAFGAVLGVVLLLLEGEIVDSAQVVVLEGHVLEFGAEDVDPAAILEDDLVVQMTEGFFRLGSFTVLDKSLPDLGLLKDEYFDDSAVGAEELVEVFVRYDVAVLVVDAY